MAKPIAIARVRWLSPTRNPAPGSTMWATAVFVLGNDAEVIPGWLADNLHEKAVFLVVAGPQPIAEARIAAMLLEA
ncbi:MAG: hypothetical protein QOJ93_952 [Actinomycetota bacterium]|jgi:hypothetical protein|nr:hypothetical protein [Actinomycetota bacterium]